jgi:hypothetical protein
MEAVNESSKLIAQAIMLLQSSFGNQNDDQRNIEEAIKLLEEVLEKLTTNI